MKFLEYIKDIRVQTVIIVVIFICSFIWTRNENLKNENLKKSGVATIGTIIDRYVTGNNETYYVKYTYSIDEEIYTKSVNYSWKFSNCEKTRDCIGRKFTVYYDKDNPDNSFIDFNDER